MITYLQLIGLNQEPTEVRKNIIKMALETNNISKTAKAFGTTRKTVRK